MSIWPVVLTAMIEGFWFLSQAAGQVPTIAPGGVVNGASFSRATPVVPGSIAALFGQYLATTSEVANSFPLPRVLGGVTVKVGGVAAPLLYTSPTQINFIVPTRGMSLTSAGNVTIAVESVAYGKGEVEVGLASFGLGLFTRDASGCGQAAGFNLNAQGGIVADNDKTHSVAPGGYMTLFGTGLGPVYNTPADGEPAQSQPLPLSISVPFVRFGLPGFRQYEASPLYSGRAPGFAGLDQLNLWIHPEAPESCSLPVWVGSWRENTRATISVSRDGSACRDAPPATVAALVWSRRAETGPARDEHLVSEQFRGWIVRGPGNLVRTTDDGPWRGYVSEPTRPDLRSDCAFPLVEQLSAGRLALTGPGGTVLQAEVVAGTEYAVNLPPGTLRSGPFQVSAQGGAIAPFRTSVDIPAPIQITTDLQPGTVISNNRFVLRWSGGASGGVVRASLIRYIYNGGVGTIQTVSAPSGANQLTIEPAGIPPATTENAELFISFEPPNEAIARFGASEGVRGSHLWQYQFRYRGLKVRYP